MAENVKNLKKIQQIVAHKGGGTILSYDFSTLEVRIFSAISCDPTLRDVLLSGADLHCNTARNIFPELKGMSDKEIKEHHSGLRSKAKSCLVAGTKILLSDGSIKNIEDLSCSDKLLSRDEITNSLIISNIVKVAETNRVTHLIKLEMENGWSLKCTPDHLIRLKSREYKEAQNLNNSDEVDSLDSNIKEIKNIHLDSSVPVYDIEVTNPTNSHNFWANGVFVHNCMFGLLYGKSAYNFSKDWGCSVEEAQETIDKMMGAYKGIKTYVEYQHKFAREHGYIVDVFGCTRPLPDAMLPDTKSNRKLLNHAMNASQNSGIQSSASRMAWIAGTHIAEEMLMHDLQSVMIGGVHDSTYLDIYPGELIPVFKICQFHAGTVPNVIYDWMNGNKMFIDFGLGQSWGREMDIKSFEEKDGKFILNIKGGNCNWDYLKRELDEAYDYKILEMKEGDPIPPEEREELPIEVPTQLISLKLEFEDPCPNMDFKSKYFVGNGFYGKREE